MHTWGDEFFVKHGEDFEQARKDVYKLLKYARIGFNGKEKYGTFRLSVSFYTGWWPIQALLKPSYVYYALPNWVYKLEFSLQKPVKYLGIVLIISSLQKMWFNYTFQKVCKKYPHLVDELISEIDNYDLIKPGIFGKIDGSKVHGKFWK